MTHPNSVNMTFDTSLIDLNVSFSTTESDPSDAGPASIKTNTFNTTQNDPQPSKFTSILPPKAPTPVQYLPTQATYDQWAFIYDSDGNMLQSIDDIELSTLLADFLSLATAQHSSPTIHILDLGCGTGRNTIKLLSYPWPSSLSVRVTGLDFSRAMLDVAAQKTQRMPHKPHFALADCFPTMKDASASPFPVADGLESGAPPDAVISTLVLEHVPLDAFFATLAAVVRPGGYALVTNMHEEMGSISQAGFVDERTGVKVRGESWVYSVDEVLDMAKTCRFEITKVKERAMEKVDVEEGRVGSRGLKWMGVKVWFGVVLRMGA